MAELTNEDTQKEQLAAKPYDYSRLDGVPTGYVPLPTNVVGQADGSLWGANFRDTTTYGSFTNTLASNVINDQAYRSMSTKDILDRIPRDLLLDYADRYIGKDPKHFDEVTDQIRSEILDGEVIARHPWKSLAIGVPLQVADPVNWLPLGELYNNAKRGTSLLRSIIGTGSAAAISATAQEAIIQQNQLTREGMESAYNIVTAAIIGGAMGAIGTGLNARGERKAAAQREARANAHQEVMDVLTDKEKELDPNGLLKSEDLAKVPDPIRTAMKFTPMNRLVNSPFGTSKFFANTMYEHNYTLLKHLDEETDGASVEGLIRLDQGKTKNTLVKYQNIYYNMLGINRGPFKGTRAKMAEGITMDQFNEAVWRRLSTDAPSDIAHVNEAAEMLKRELFEPTRQKAIQLGLLSEADAPRNAIGYIMSVYNKQKILEQGGKGTRAEGSFPVFLHDKFKKIQEQIKVFKQSPVYQENKKLLDRTRTSLKNLQAKIRLANAEEDFKVEDKLTPYDNGTDFGFIYDAESNNLFPNKIRLYPYEKEARVILSQLTPDNRGKGIGKNLYKAAIAEAEKRKLKFVSDESVSDDALRVYKALEKEGYVFEYNKNIKKIEIKPPIGTPIDEAPIKYRYESTDAEPVVRLVSTPKKELNKKLREQYKALKELIKQTEKIIRDAAPKQGLNSDGELFPVVSDEALWSQVEQTIDHILGDNQGQMLNPILDKLSGGSAKPLKGRKMTVAQDEMMEWHITDIPRIVDMYSRAMHPMLRLTELAQKLGVKDINEMREYFSTKIMQEYDAAAKGKTGEDIAKLEKQRDADIRDMKTTLALLQGVYGAGPNVLNDSARTFYQNFMKWNYIRLLGYMTISSMADAGVQVFVHGPYRFIHQGLVQSFSQVRQIAKQDLRAIGYALETELGSRIKSYAEHQGLSTNPGPFTKGLDALTQGFGNLSLMNQWNSLMQSIAGHVGIDRTLQTIHKFVKGEKVSDIEMERVIRNGLDKKHWKTIYEFTKDNDSDGTLFADWTNWAINTPAEREALTQFQASIAKEIDNIVIVPGLGDKFQIGNIDAHQPLGKMLFQFKTFLMAATNRVTVSGIQRRNDVNTYLGVLAMLSMGALSYIVASLVRGDEPDLSFKRLGAEAVDKSGLLGIWGELGNIGAKALGFTGTSRYASRDVVGSLIGPSAGAVSEVVSTLQTVMDSMRSLDDPKHRYITTKDAQKLLRLAPMQNLFYIHQLNRKATRGLALELGAVDND